jgi:hypothetical protein
MINADKPQLWKDDIAASVDLFNRWFLRFAPKTFRDTRLKTTRSVEQALRLSTDLTDLSVQVLASHPEILPTLRMCCCPPLAQDRLTGLARTNRSLVQTIEKKGVLPARMGRAALEENLRRILNTVAQMLDIDIFPWLVARRAATEQERHRASTIVADRLWGAVADPLIRNAQEQRQLALLGKYLRHKGYKRKSLGPGEPLTAMQAGTFAVRMIVVAGEPKKVNIPVDVVVQPKKLRAGRLPVLIEAKSAGDFANVNKRRKEEAAKMHQLRAAYGNGVVYVLFLCGYFDAGYLGYEAAEGIDWVWEHRIRDLDQLGI